MSTPLRTDGTTDDWNAYWQNRPADSVHMQDGPQNEPLARFWSQLFDQSCASAPCPPKVLDIGCGAGAVSRPALLSTHRHWPGSQPRVCGLDRSPAAVAELRRLSPEVAGAVANADRMPFADHSFDIVTSQFGIEYAGAQAPTEAARVLRPGGLLAMTLHVRGGGIYAECDANRKAITCVRDCRLLAAFREVVEVAPLAARHPDAKALLHAAARKFAAAVESTVQILRRFGRNVASGLVFRLYADTRRMYHRLFAYAPHEVIAWTESMSRQLDDYLRRMASMLQSALDPVQLGEWGKRLQALGLRMQLQDQLGVGHPVTPVAWVLTAIKPGP
ncbi:MAG: methyltransferase domain-containing protein [Gammaproteobacteria bacterium]